MNSADYELIIVGGGPAGLTAGLYAARSQLKAVLLEKGAVGGQVLLTDWIDNYPGFPEGLTGFDLVDKMAAQAARFGLETQVANIISMDLSGPLKKLYLEDGKELTAKALIIATGARPNTLGIPGEAELTGKGVSYCATCDAPFYRDQEVAVVGGGNTAVQEAIYLTRFASKVTVIHRRDTLRATKVYQDEAFANEKIDFLWNSVVTHVDGKNGVESIRIKDTMEGQESVLKLQGIFVLIGTIPNNEMLPAHQLAMEDGFLVTDNEMRTNIPGVTAAGDIRSKAVRQVVNAAGEGAVAEQSIEEYLGEHSS